MNRLEIQKNMAILGDLSRISLMKEKTNKNKNFDYYANEWESYKKLERKQQ